MNEDLLKNIQFAKYEDIIQPKGGRVSSLKTEQDHFLGGLLGDIWEVLCPDGNWLPLAWANPEIQRVSDGDTYFCVTFSHNSNHRFIWKKRYNEDFNTSERFLAIGSGTVRNQGNSPKQVAEWSRLHGWLIQDDCPMPNTLNECYASLGSGLLTKGLGNLKITLINWKWLPNNSVAAIKTGLTFSPVQVSVQSYAVNAKGYIVNSGGDYIHEVDIIADGGDFWIIWDSESLQWLKFDKGYNFDEPMIHSIKKSDLSSVIASYEGKQVKSSKSGIYLIQNGLKRPYPDKLTFYTDGGEYGADGQTYVNIDDTVLSFIDVGATMTIQETKEWPLISDQYPLIRTLAEPQNLLQVKTIIDQNKIISDHYDSLRQSALVQTPPIVQDPSLWDKLISFLTPHAAVGKFGALTSSANPAQLALTVKGLLVGLVPLVLTYIGGSHPNLSSINVTDVIDALFTLGATAMTTWGVVRKAIVAYQNK